MQSDNNSKKQFMISTMLLLLIFANRYFSVLEKPPINFDFYMNVGVIFIAFLLIISTLLYKSVFNRENA